VAWQGILGHDAVVEQFRRSLARGRLPSTFLFVGPTGIGKRTFALKLAQTLLCQAVPAEQMAPCGKCDSCVQVAALTHPDLIVISKPADRSAIPLAALVGDDNRRMREGLCHDISLKAFMGGRKVAIIDDADFLNEEGANCLLKTLEEPPPKSVMILIGTSADKQLPTIRSRSQTIRFGGLDRRDVGELLNAQGLVADREQAERLAEFAEGSLARALELADEQLWSFRETLLQALARRPLASVPLAQQVIAFVDEAGKEAGPRRARARQLITMAVEFYRQLLRTLSDAELRGDAALAAAVNAAARGGTLDAEGAAASIERSLEALAHIDRNAHQATLIECWLDDLSRIAQTGHAVRGFAD
jgi:DNA polymerase III subunit delta'